MSSASPMRPADTLRARLAIWYVAALTLTLSAFAVLLYVWLAQTLYRHHDSELQANADRISTLLRDVAAGEEPIARALRVTDSVPRMVMVRGRHGELIYRSPLLEIAEPTIGQHEALVHAAAHAPSNSEFFTASLERLGLVRFICTPLEGVDSSYLQVGNPLGDVPATLHAVRTASIILVPLIVVIMSFGAWLIAGRALAPLAVINVTLQDIQATDLSKRVEVNPADRDLHALVRTINGLLSRLDRAFHDLRAFTADASHQIQTPLAIMKGTIEFMRRASNPEQRDALLDDLDKEVNDMSAVVSDLQTLSLADADRQQVKQVELDFSAVCRDVVEIMTALGEQQNVRVEGDIEPDIRLTGDPVKLRQVLLNLGDNAIKYTPAGGCVRCALHRDGAWAVVVVSDTGVGIDEADVPQIFERFYRATAEHNTASGTGLGLAIVKRFVEVHSGTIAVTTARGKGTQFSVRLPTRVLSKL